MDFNQNTAASIQGSPETPAAGLGAPSLLSAAAPSAPAVKVHRTAGFFGRLFSLKHILSLATGWTAVGLLITMLGLSIHYIFNNDMHGSYSASLGGAYLALLITTSVFALTHIGLYAATINGAEEKHSKITRAVSLIFAGGLFLTVLGFVVSLFCGLLGPVLGLVNSTGKEIGETVLVALAGVIVAGGVMVAHLIAKSRLSGFVYVSAFGTALLTGVILFVVLPAADIRGFVSDQKKVDDLSLIETAISNYASANNKLPATLKDLAEKDLEDLKGKLSDYTYKADSSSSSSSRYAQYELCADGFAKDTLDGNVYAGGYKLLEGALNSAASISSYSSFYDHSKGNYCWTRDKTLSSSRSSTYNYDDYDYEDYYSL